MMRLCVCSLLQSVLHYVVLTVEDDAQGPNNALWMVLQVLRRDAVLLAKCKAIIRTVLVGSAFYDALIDLIERNRPTARLDETHQQAFIQVLSTLHKQTPIAVLFVGNGEQYQADVARLSHVLPLRWVLIGDTSTSVEGLQTFTPASQIAIDCEFWVALTFARRQLHGDILRDMIGHVHSVMQFMQFIAVVYNRGYLTWNTEERSWQYASNATELVDALTDGWFDTVSDEFKPLLNVNAMATYPLRYADLATLHLGDGHRTKNLLDTLIWYSLLIAVDGVVYFSTPAIWRTVRDAMTPAMEAQALTLLIQCMSGVERLRYWIERYDILVMQVIFTGSALRLARLWRQEAQMQHWQRQLLVVHERTEGVVGLRYDHELAWSALAHHKPTVAMQHAQRAIANAAHHRYGVMLPGDVESMMVALMQQVQSDDQVVGTLLHAQTTLLGYMRQLSTPLQRWEFVNHFPYLSALLQSRWDVHRVHVVWAHPQVSVTAVVPVWVRIPVVVPEVAHLLEVLDRVDMAVVIYRHVHMQGGVLDSSIVQQLCMVSLDEATQLLHRLQTQLGIEISASTGG